MLFGPLQIILNSSDLVSLIIINLLFGPLQIILNSSDLVSLILINLLFGPLQIMFFVLPYHDIHMNTIQRYDRVLGSPTNSNCWNVFLNHLISFAASNCTHHGGTKGLDICMVTRSFLYCKHHGGTPTHVRNLNYWHYLMSLYTPS